MGHSTQSSPEPLIGEAKKTTSNAPWACLMGVGSLFVCPAVLTMTALAAFEYWLTFIVLASVVLITLAAFFLCALLGGPKLKRAIHDTASFYGALWYFWVLRGKLCDIPYFADRRQARVQVFSLALIMDLWNKPHYRNGSFQHDMSKNLRNVAIPGTGMPLSFVVSTKFTGYLFLIFAYPIIALVSALRVGGLDVELVADTYSEQLLTPQDWFSFWQLNCRLATWHASTTGETDYSCEDKWTFLTKAEDLGIAITPCMKMAGIVCKHRNEEGGLGFASFKNATEGGDWIIQEKIENGPFLASMLPEDAPLSTFRIISASRGGLLSGTSSRGEVQKEDVMALSCVWRAGRAGAATDHSAVLFNVDPDTGMIKAGTTNNHWYQRGFSKIFTTPWTSKHDITCHPNTNQPITGTQLPNIQAMREFVCDAHLRMMPHVPLAGWDVAWVGDDNRMILLEANLSCNFFRGDFDQERYFKFIEDYFLNLEQRQPTEDYASVPFDGTMSIM